MNLSALTPARTVARSAFGHISSNIVLIWLIAMPFLLAMVATRNWDEIVQVGGTMQRAETGWLAAGIGIQLAILLSPVLTYKVILRRLGHTLAFRALAGMHMQRIVVGALAPVSGPAGAIVFIRALNKRAVTTSDALTLLAMRSISTQVAFVMMLLTVIALHGKVYALAVGGVLLIALTLVVPLLRRSRLPACIGPWQWRKLPRPVGRQIISFAARFRRHHIHPRDLVRPVIITVVTRFTGMALLAVSIKAMGVDVAPRALAAAVIAETIATIAMPIFHGIGVVEAATAVALQQSGISAEAAIGAALLWRAFQFWLPLGVALTAQGATFGVARFAGWSLPGMRAPRPALAMAEAPGWTRRRLAFVVLIVLVAFAIGGAVSEAAELL